MLVDAKAPPERIARQAVDGERHKRIAFEAQEHGGIAQKERAQRVQQTPVARSVSGMSRDKSSMSGASASSSTREVIATTSAVFLTRVESTISLLKWLILLPIYIVLCAPMLGAHSWVQVPP